MDGEQAIAVEEVWEIRQDEATGQAYYWNAITGETSWNSPPQLEAADELSGAGDVVHLWTQAYDDDGRVYYLNTDTMETRWVPPPMADELQEDVSVSSDPDALAVTGGRGRRPSTAEQMDKLNRLLSGEGEDEVEPPEDGDNSADHAEENDMPPPPVSSEATEKALVVDAEACPWMMFVNEDDGVPYYYNHITGTCLWEPPEEFLSFHREVPQHEQPPDKEIDKGALTSPEAGSSAQTTAQDDPHVSEDIAEHQNEAGSAASSARLIDAVMQAVITPEFEEKVRQAIAAATNTPVSSSRLVLVRTPTQEQLAPRTGRSARSGSSSARPRSGPSRPTSAGVISRPGSAVSSVRDQIKDFSPVEEESSVSAVENEAQGDADRTSADEISTPNEEDEEVPVPSSVQASTSEAIEQDETIVDSKEEINSGVVELTGAETGQVVVGAEAEAAVEEAKHIDARLEGLGEMVDEATPESVGMEAVASVNLSEVPSIPQRVQTAALALQCMARCFIARKRVKHIRDECHNSDPPTNTTTALIETTGAAQSVAPPEAEVGAAMTSPRLALQENPTDEDTGARISVLAPTPVPEDAHIDLLEVPPLDTETPLESDATSVDGSVDTPPSSRPAVLPAQSTRRLSAGASGLPRPERTLISTRLPSVLDVTTYFPQRRAVTCHLEHAGSSATASGLTAITRKKVDVGSPPRHRRASQQEAERMQVEHEQLLDSRRKEEERLQRAQVGAYQRIYAEGRKAWEAEKQRLLEEKRARDNQRDHDAEVEKRARMQAQRERDSARERHGTAGDEADRLVWEHLKTQRRPTEHSVGQFRDALAQALDAAHFPGKVCAERARELHERIERLHRTSWAVDSQLEAVELALLSELPLLTDHQRPLQGKYAAKLRRRLERILDSVQSWQRVLDEWEVGKEDGSTSRYWATIQTRYAPASATYASDESRRQYVLNAWRGAPGGDSLIHVAAWNGWAEHVRLLIEEGADVNLVDSSVSLRTPLHEACRAGHAPIVEQLLRSGARLSAVDASGDSPLHVACRGGWTRVVRILLMAANDLGEEADPSTLDENAPLTLEEFLNFRNGKGRRAIEVATLPSLREELKSSCMHISNRMD